MPCYRALKAYRAPGGQISFDSKSGWSDLPLELPCGQCIGCRLQRAADWTVRLMHESQMHLRSSFVTLTYDEEHFPRDETEKDPRFTEGSLRVDHWQKFAKRTRKALGPFRFFHAGEYGPENLRPHYHALLFGLDFAFDRYHWRNNEFGDPLFRSPLLEKLWPLGHSEIGQVTPETAAYVARYTVEKCGGELAEKRYARVDPETGECWMVRPEYATMSRNPGIGATWFEKYSGDVYPSDECVIRGRSFRPPRFYDDRLPEPALAELKLRRARRAREHAEDLTPERLRVREEVSSDFLKARKRKL